MLAKKCDRCGELYENYNGKFEKVPDRANTVSLLSRYADEKSAKVVKVYDLCPRCMEDAVKYLTDPDSEVV